MAEKELFKPSSRGARGPTDDAQNNGRIVNPPRYAELSGRPGRNPQHKGDMAKNQFTIKKPGGVEK